MIHSQQPSPTLKASLSPSDSQASAILNVLAFGARGDGSIDDSSAIQSVINATAKSKPCLFFPHGIYRLDVPIKLKGGECLKGENAANLNGTTVLLPNTAAFVTADPLSQLQSVTLSGFLIRGGRNAIDLGLFHEVDISDITCEDQTGWCFSHVRGERHHLRNIFCWHRTIPGEGCLSFADVTHSVFAATYAKAHWTDQWWDRSIIDRVSDLGGPAASDQYTIWSNGGGSGSVGSFSNSNLSSLCLNRLFLRDSGFSHHRTPDRRSSCTVSVD
jgi:Pectate lyase superfamily protein